MNPRCCGRNYRRGCATSHREELGIPDSLASLIEALQGQQFRQRQYSPIRPCFFDIGRQIVQAEELDCLTGSRIVVLVDTSLPDLLRCGRPRLWGESRCREHVPVLRDSVEPPRNVFTLAGIVYEWRRPRGGVKKTFAFAVCRYKSVVDHRKIHPIGYSRHVRFRLDGPNTIVFVKPFEKR